MQTTFIPASLEINDTADIQSFYDKLLALPLHTVADLEKFLVNYSEIQSVYHEQAAWAYINMTRKTDDKALVARHEKFSTVIGPVIDTLNNEVRKKITACPHFDKLNEARYEQYVKGIKRDLELFRAENVPLEAQLAGLSSRYSQLAGSMQVEIDGEKMPIPKAAVRLQLADRVKRKEAWTAIQSTYTTARDGLNQILTDMVALRHKVAVNTGYKNFRDFQHDNLHRFDYTVSDVLKFHDSILEHVVPFKKEIAKNLAKRLNLENDFRPWDIAAKPAGEKALKPFEKPDEFLDKSIKVFDTIRPEFGKNLSTMRSKGLFDLESRQGKAPGGYNYGLEITGMPFIFMNAAGVHRDLITIMHEGGHAMQSFLMNNEPLIQYRNPPSEVAETASMSMELISSTHWREFYADEDFKRARREHLEDIVDVLPWVAIVDGYQHWLYTNPQNHADQRDAYFDTLMPKFGSGVVNWDGLEANRKSAWLKQLHIFEVPFYYIEYAIAQLGALQIYRNYRKDPTAAINQYIAGLTLGSSKSIPEVWKKLGIKFDFSGEALKGLMDFVHEEWESLKD